MIRPDAQDCCLQVEVILDCVDPYELDNLDVVEMGAQPAPRFIADVVSPRRFFREL